jgi:hypothetical protein
MSTMLPGLVRGVRQWSDARSAALPRLPPIPVAEVGDGSSGDGAPDDEPGPAAEPELRFEPINDEPLPARERLHPHIH